ncbi:TRZ/ATZ family hydrolase [Maricurvus nonylphenolicus]|uniref:TRZ/ATZ family hydrolase n=1 Tax=Maricurvus nonylphenolicus TaxID=1008307 RepID=UPI0036F43A03
METVDTLIHAGWIIPVIPENQVLSECSLAINDGRIAAIVPTTEAKSRFSATEELDLTQHLIIPGLINAHGHAAMSLLRGFADDHPLQTWLEEHIWPAEGQWVDAEFVKDGTELALAEMIRSGTTCFSDMYFFPEAAAKAAFESGIRAQITFPVFDFPSAWGQGPDEYLSKGLALNDDYRSNELITIGFGPHAPYTVSDEPLQRIATIAEEMQAPIQIHLHETAFEVDEAVKNTGKRPIQRLADLGLLSPLTQCVHMTQISDDDLELLKSTGAHIVHCPESNLKLASGFCPVDKLQQTGINVALGTDGAASNNDLDLLGELRTAALLAKGVSGNASALNAHQAIRMTTLNGAKAMGIDHVTGSLETGKAADVIAIAFDELESMPLYNPASQLVYAQRSHRITHSWVNGKCLMHDRQLQTLSEHEIITKAQRWQKKIAGQSH